MKLRGALLLAVLAGCSDPATSAQRGDAARDVPDAVAPDAAAPDAVAPDAVAPDAVAPDAVAPDAIAPDAIAPDAIAPDAVAPDAVAPDAIAPDAIAPDAVAPDAARDAGALRVVQLVSASIGSALQDRLDALYSVAGVTAERVTASMVTPEMLRNRVIVAAFSARPADWTTGQARVVLDAVRGGAWVLGEAFGPWLLQDAGALTAVELAWSRTPACTGTFYWLQPARGEESFFAFAGIEPWTPTSVMAAPTGPVVSSYPTDALPMEIPVFTALPPNRLVPHPFVQYIVSYCENNIARHPWCIENPRLCGMDRGALDDGVEEYVIGSGRLFVVSAASHQPAGIRWGEVITRLQANVLREGLRRTAL